MRLYLPLFAGAAMLLCGCPNPNTYTVPRTLDPGKLQVQVAPEVIGVSVNTPTTTTNNMGQVVNGTTTETGFLPMVPSAGIRYGIVQNFDFGARLMNFDSLAVDGKVQLVRSTFDLALDPGLQAFYAGNVGGTSFGIFYFHMPVLLGFNLSEAVTLVLAPGATFVVATGSATNATGVSAASTATGFLGRLGVGADFRVARNFALHPEVTFMKSFNDSNALIWVAGLGFNIGAQPNYSDMSGNPPPPAGQ